MADVEYIGDLTLGEYKHHPVDIVYLRMLGGGYEDVFKIAEALEDEEIFHRYVTWDALSLLHKHGVVVVEPDCQIRLPGQAPFN
jgi:hypothetical protein